MKTAGLRLKNKIVITVYIPGISDEFYKTNLHKVIIKSWSM